MVTQNPPIEGPRKRQLRGDESAYFDIVGGTDFGRYDKISSEQTFNMMISDSAFVPFPGYEIAKTIVPNGNAREIYNSKLANSLVVVIDDGLYLVDSSLTFVRVGSLLTTSGKVFISDNFASQIAVVDGVNIYVYNYSDGTFTTVFGSDISMKPGYISYQDTYFIAADLTINKFRLSQPSQGTDWRINVGQTTFEGTMQSKPNKIVATVAFDRQLLVMGQTVTESWTDVGYGLFPYQRSNFYAIDYGCLTSETIAVGYNMCVWLASNEKSGPAIMVTQEGGKPEKLSNDGLDFLFAQLSRPDDSYGFLMKIEGHIIYVLTFVTDNYTFCYDFNTQMFFTLTDEIGNYFIAKRIAFFNNAYYFVSFKDGNLYRLSSKHTTYAGLEIPRIRIPKNIRFADSARFIPSNLTLTMETGISPPHLQEPGVGDPPIKRYVNRERIDLSISRDGGYQYGNIVSQYMPVQAKRKNLFNFYNLGAVNDGVIKIRFWGFGRFVCTGGFITVNS